MSGRRLDQKGYTLVEVIFVLAIAGLLLVVVLLAVSGAQRARRDAQRKEDLAQLEAAVGKYAANHFLQTPEDDPELDDVFNNYFGNHTDPLTGQPYTPEFQNRGAPHDTPPPPFGTIRFVQGHVCGQDPGTDTLITNPAAFGATTRQHAVLVGLEKGGAYCITGED